MLVAFIHEKCGGSRCFIVYSDSNRSLLELIVNVLSSKSELLPVDRRHAKWSRTLKSGKLPYGGFNQTVFDCLIIDMLDSGARVETSVMIGVPEFLLLRTNDHVERRAYRRRAFGDQIGVEFVADAAQHESRGWH